MAEPVEDDVSFLGTEELANYTSPNSEYQVPSAEYHRNSSDYRSPEYRSPVPHRTLSQARPERNQTTRYVIQVSGVLSHFLIVPHCDKS